MNRLTRRQALALGGAAVLPATAGCASLNPWSGDGSDRPSDFRAWLPAEDIWTHERPVVTYEAVDGLIADLPSEHERIQDIQASVAQWTVRTGQLDGRLVVDAGALLGTLFLGGFDAQTVLDQIDPAEENVESHGDFTLVGSSRAIGPGVVVISTSARSFVDAYRGDVDRIQEVASRWERVLDAFSDSDLLRVTAPESAPFDVLGIGVDVGQGSSFEGTAQAHFVAEADAEANVNSLDQHVRESIDDDVNTFLTDVRRDANVVEADAVWPSIPF